MKFNSKKYNIIICVMLILIGLVYFVTASFYSQSWSDTPSNPDNPTPPITNPDVPPIDDTGDENTDGVTQAPVFSNGHDAIKYAVNIINSGIPFIYQFYNTTISADYVKVEAYEKLYRNKNHDLMLVWSDTDASIPGFSSIAKKRGVFLDLPIQIAKKLVTDMFVTQQDIIEKNKHINLLTVIQFLEMTSLVNI